MYTLEFYDSVMGIENQYHFSKSISPQQAFDIFNHIGFEVHPYSKVDTPLSMFDNKDAPIGSFSFKLSSYNFVDFDKVSFDDYLLDDL